LGRGRDLGSEIRILGIKLSRIGIPDPWDKIASDPGSGSATLHYLRKDIPVPAIVKVPNIYTIKVSVV
jgi:hypothetical protein